MTYLDSLDDPRFAARLRGLLIGPLLCLAVAMPALAAGTLDKARESGKLTFGYRADARPFSYTDPSGKAAGFSVALCRRIADAVKDELKLPALAVDFVPVTVDNRFDAVVQGKVDLVCGTATPTLERRALVDFSIPIFYSGIGAIVREDVSRRVRDALADRPDPAQPVWRGAPGLMTEKVTFAVVGGTTIERSLAEALKARRLDVSVVPVADYQAGLQMVLEHRATALFGNRPVLLDAARSGDSSGELAVIDRAFTREVLALALPRGDAPFRLVVDRTLSRLYRSKDFAAFYATFFGPPDAGVLELFQALALPE
jgi:polar amino acid transport system substrate-binding protein